MSAAVKLNSEMFQQYESLVQKQMGQLILGGELFMKREHLDKFREMFETQKKNIIFADRVMCEDFHVDLDECKDEVDHAATDMEQSLRLRLRNRENLFLKKVDDALRRIEKGEFGLCDVCGNDIEIKRLEARPTATHCIACKEDEERREGLTADGRKHKSLGMTLPRSV